MPELTEPLPGDEVDATWGEQVSNRVVSRYATTAARDAGGPFEEGTPAYILDINAFQVWDGSDWLTLQDAADVQAALTNYYTKAEVDALVTPGAWRAPTLLNGWSNFGAGEQTARIRTEPNDLVRIQGLITGGTATVNTPIFNLAGSETPDQNYQVSTTSNNAYGQIKVNAAGTVVFRVGSAANLSLDGVYSLI